MAGTRRDRDHGIRVGGHLRLPASRSPRPMAQWQDPQRIYGPGVLPDVLGAILARRQIVEGDTVPQPPPWWLQIVAVVQPRFVVGLGGVAVLGWLAEHFLPALL